MVSDKAVRQAIPYGYCHCGCGLKTPPYSRTNVTYGHVAGEPARYIRGHGHRTKSLKERFHERVDYGTPDECWEWQAGRIPGGYGAIVDLGQRFASHRLAWEFENGPIPQGREVCHTCDNPPCCNPAHLFLGSTKDNAEDRDRKGRGAWGEKSPHAKLTAQQVLEARKRVAAGETQAGLAREFGVAKTTMHQAVRGRRWRGLG